MKTDLRLVVLCRVGIGGEIQSGRDAPVARALRVPLAGLFGVYQAEDGGLVLLAPDGRLPDVLPTMEVA